MATRGTYLFSVDSWQPKICFYVHLDNYPKGAALKFFNAFVLLKNSTKTTPDTLSPKWRGKIDAAFMRANIDAEFTYSHETHEDAEYRYTTFMKNVNVLNERVLMVRVEHVNRHVIDEKIKTEIKEVYMGCLLEFIHRELLGHKEDEPFLSENWENVFSV